MIPPNSIPAAPPRPFIAAHAPIARCSCGPGRERGGDDRQRARRHQRAAETLRRARGDERSAVGREAAGERREREHAQRQHEHPALAEVVGGAAAEHQEAGERDRVGVDDPLQFGRREAEARLDRGQRDVDDAQVEDDHELRHAADDQQPRPNAIPRCHSAAAARAPAELSVARRSSSATLHAPGRVGARTSHANDDWSPADEKNATDRHANAAAVLAGSFAAAGCGGKGCSPRRRRRAARADHAATTTTTHKHNTKPAY